jgi:hypothetical protein
LKGATQRKPNSSAVVGYIKRKSLHRKEWWRLFSIIPKRGACVPESALQKFGG